MYLPQIQPAPRNDNMLLYAAKSLGEKKERNQLQQLATQAIAGDQNSLAQLAALSPQSASAIKGVQDQKKLQSEQVVLGGAATLLHAKPEERPALYQSMLPLIKSHGLTDLPDQYPGDAALNGFVAQIAAQGGEHGAFATSLLQGSGFIPQKPTDAQSNYGFLQDKTPEEQAQFMGVLHSGSGEQGPKVVGMGGQLIDSTGKVLASNPIAKALGANEALITIGADGQPQVKITTGPGGQQKPYGAPDYPAGGAPTYGPQGQPVSGGTPTPVATPEQQQQGLLDINKAQKIGTEQGQQAADRPQASLRVQAVQNNVDLLKQKADELKKGISGWSTGAAGVVTRKIPGTSTYDFGANLQSFKDQIFNQTILAMRDASKTGGAVGQVSDAEGKRFENMLGSLDAGMSGPQLSKNIDAVVAQAQKMVDMVKSAYQQTYGGEAAPTGAKPPAGKSISLRALMSSPRAQGMTEAQVRQKAEAAGYTVQ